MQTQIKEALVVKSASAGSGKTFSLVQDYLKLTLVDEVGPKNFARIIAMTFTNKAAWEMKERIIEALDQLAHIDQLEGKMTKKAQSLMDSTVETTKLSSEIIKSRAKRVLSEILHNYEDFNVLTIDKFSLRLIRTFSRDLDLQENFEVTLDEKGLLERVIDDLMSKIGKADEQEITDLALSYAKSNLNEGDSWDFRKNLIKFSTVLTKENEQAFVDALLEKEFTKDGYNDLLSELRAIDQEHLSKCKEIYDYFMSLNTTEDDYPNKSRGIYGQLSKLPARTIYASSPPSSTILKTISGENVKPAHNVDGRLMEMMNELYEFEAKSSDRVFTLKTLRSNFYNLALLRYISKELTEFKERENLIGIYEFGRRIADLLKRENTLYIYERLGNRYNHYLLDEFQDTSRLQWLNLVPLVHESIANKHQNLIVGDPKQAIYRFRNGLVEQFVALPNIYNPDNDEELNRISDLFQKMGRKDALETNYRSRKFIVEFNNTFFRYLLDILPKSFNEYYEDIKQIPNSDTGGFVQVDRYDSKNVNDEIDGFEVAYLLEKVAKCRADNFEYGDICILVRGKKEGQLYAKALTDGGMKVVSSDSLLVSSDAMVQFCIDYLNLRRNTSNTSLQIKFASAYFRMNGKDPVIALSEFWINEQVGSFDFPLFIKQHFENRDRLFFAFENLYDLGVKLLNLANLSELKNPYLHHLMDIFQEYDLKNGPDIRGFIEDWNASLKNSAIQMPENKEAIKIMTIHKSKGLEFPVVIIPRMTWKIKTSSNSHFIQLENGELIYSNLKKDNAPAYITERYQEEYRQLLLDELNVLYVALTRPSERLYLLLDTSLPKELEYYSQLNQAVSISLGQWDENEEIVTFKNDETIKIGEETVRAATSSDSSLVNENAFIPKDISDNLWFPDLALLDEEARENESFNENQRFGKQLHNVLSKMDDESSLDEVIQEFVENGEIEPKDVALIKAKAMEVAQRLAKEEFAQSAKQILNEQTIIINEKQVRRPDRIYIGEDKVTIIDFKTGEKEKKHIKQVSDYCKQLYDMGYDQVEGFLLYTEGKEGEMELIKV